MFFSVPPSVQLSLPSNMRIMRGFDHVYVAAQLHFHWGTKEVPGSEHTIDNVHFPAEVSWDKGNTLFNGLSKDKLLWKINVTMYHLEMVLLAQSFWNMSDYKKLHNVWYIT